MKENYIYKIVNPKGKIYIGQTTNFKKRLYQYKSYCCDRQFKLYNSLIKYGYDSHFFEVIEICNNEIIDEREIFWIKSFDSYNNGLNLTKGGKGKNGMTYSNKSNISKSKKGKPAWNKGLTNIYTQETKDSISKKLKGKVPWNKGLNYMLIDGEKVMLNKENIGKVEYNKKVKVMCLNTGEVFDCLKDVSNKFKINYSTLKYNIRKGKNTINGITFKKIGYISNNHTEETKKSMSQNSKLKIKIL